MYQSKWGQAALYFFILMHLSLALFERPAVPGLEMSYWVSYYLVIFVVYFKW